MENLSPSTGTGALSSLSRNQLENTMWLAGHKAPELHPCWKSLRGGGWGEIRGFVPSGVSESLSPRAGKWQRAGLGFLRASRIHCGNHKSTVFSFRVHPGFLRNLQPGDLGWGGGLRNEAALPPRRAPVPRLGRLAPASAKGMGTHPNPAPCGFSPVSPSPHPVGSSSSISVFQL